MTTYYRATFDPRIADQWHLAAPRDEFGNEIRGKFTVGLPYAGLPPVKLPIYQDGRPLEVSFGFEQIVVVSRQAKEAVAAVAAQDCEFFEVAIPRMKEPWHILNAVHPLDCFDESKSEYTPAPSGGKGRYAIVTKLMIDPVKVQGQQMFRVQYWNVGWIVSDAVKAAIESVPNHGVRFTQVTP